MLIDTRIKIDGTDITNYIAFNGVKWSRHDIDGPNAGRSMSGLMIRDRVATKIRLDITCRPLNHDELHALLNLILPEFVTVTYNDPMYGTVSKTMYANENTADFLIRKNPIQTDRWWICRGSVPDSTELWNNISFPLVER